jgi:hypothetical protein
MPPHDGVRLDEHQSRTPLGPDGGKGDPEQPISSAKTRSYDRAFESGELLPERDILKHQRAMPAAGDSQRATEQQIIFSTRSILSCRAALNQLSTRSADCGEGQRARLNRGRRPLHPVYALQRSDSTGGSETQSWISEVS